MSTRKVVFYTFAFFLFVLIVPQLCAQNEIKMSTGEAAVAGHLADIQAKGMKKALAEIVK